MEKLAPEVQMEIIKHMIATDAAQTAGYTPAVAMSVIGFILAVVIWKVLP